MKWLEKRDRSTIVVTASLGLFALFIIYLLLQLWFVRQSYVDEIERIQPRTARLLGIVANEEQLAHASEGAKRALGKVSYGPRRDSATTAASMQQQVRESMADAGLNVTGSQILEALGAEGYEQVRLEISAAGNIDAFEETLRRLENMRPLVFVESLRVKPARARRGRAAEDQQVEGDPRKLNIRFRLFSLRLRKR